MKLKLLLFLVMFLVCTVSVAAFLLERDAIESFQLDPRPTKDLVVYDGELLTINHDQSTVMYKNVEKSFIVDPLVGPDGEEVVARMASPEAFVHLQYYLDNGSVEFDVYIEETFYNANQAALDDFWDKFQVRFRILKNMTGWSSQRWFGVPLELYVYGHSAACYGGNASPTHANVVFSDPMYKTGCHKPYYENGSTYYNNPGELGDWWPYMNTALHEALHSINPYPIYTRSWLTEGWSEYYMYNVLVEAGDINQETADTYLYNGFAGYQWDPYVANDYHDTTIYNRELQRSHGYDITGHMFSKMRDEEGLDWDLFYELMNNNKDSLDRTFSLGPPYIYYTDAFVLYVFGKAMGHTDYWNQTDVLFNYYSGGGVDGHGYGARNISYSWHPTNAQPYGDFDWFAEYTADVGVDNTNPESGTPVQLTVTFSNGGDVNGKDIIWRVYDNDDLVHEETRDLNKFQSFQYTDTLTLNPGEHVIRAVADEYDIKIEQDDANNEDSVIVIVTMAPAAPELRPISDRYTGEYRNVYITPTATDPNGDDLSYSINDTRWD